MNKHNIIKLAIEATFEPSLTYYSKQGDIGNKVWQTIYPNWETNGLRILFSDIEKKEIGLIEHVRVLVVKEDIGVESFDKTLEHFMKIYTAYVEGLPDSQLKRIGVRLIGFYDPKMKFDEISRLMQPKVYPDSSSQLYKITSQDYKDVAFTAVYQKEKDNIRFQSGPVERDELIQRSQLKYLMKPSELPQSSLYFDVDYFRTKPDKKPVDVAVFLNSVNKVQADIEAFVKYIFETK